MKKSAPKLREVIGHHAAREVLKIRSADVHAISFIEGWERRDDLRALDELAKSLGLTPKVRKKALFDQVGDHHQGVLVEVKSRPQWSLDDIPAQDDDEDPYVLMALDEITDPHNLGAVLRTAWLMGVKAVLTPERRSVGLTPSVCKVASGGAEHVPVEEVHLPQTIEFIKEIGFWVYGLEGDGGTPISQVKLPKRVLWVVGAEGKGLRQSVKGVCDVLVALPQSDEAASYNASVAAAIALFETGRQHQSY